MSKTRIMFVCQGNIIRSPLAEHLFRDMVEKAGKGEGYHARSSGTSSYHVGEAPDSRMRRVAAGRGFEYTGQARQFRITDFEAFDLIIAMDQENLNILKRLAHTPEEQAKLRTMRAYDPDGDASQSVPDPYYGGINGFEVTYEIVERSCRGLLGALESGEA